MKIGKKANEERDRKGINGIVLLGSMRCKKKVFLHSSGNGGGPVVEAGPSGGTESQIQKAVNFVGGNL